MPHQAWLRSTEPMFVRIREIVFANTGIRAAVQATNRSEPAACAVDALLRETIGASYGLVDANVTNCGLLVRELMDMLGYVAAGQGKCPQPGGIGVGVVWRHPSA